MANCLKNMKMLSRFVIFFCGQERDKIIILCGGKGPDVYTKGAAAGKRATFFHLIFLMELSDDDGINCALGKRSSHSLLVSQK